LILYRKKMSEKIESRNAELNSRGYKKYIKDLKEKE